MMGESSHERGFGGVRCWANAIYVTFDSYIFESRGEGTNRGWPTSTTGDTIGCGIDFTTGKAFFTKNSVFIGEAFGGLQDKGRLYPAVGLRTPG